MKRVRYRPKSRSHISIIEMAIHAQAVVGGFYIASPFATFTFAQPYAATLLTALTTGWPLFLLAIGSIVVGALGLYAVKKRNFKFRSSMMFANIMLQFYALSAILLVQGLLPLSWLLNVTILIISVVCWAVLRRMTAVWPRGS